LDFNKISDLCNEIKKGSERHFKIFFKNTHGMVYNVCLKMGLSIEDSEEVLQDTYIQFWKQRELLEENKGVLGLLKLIAKRLVLKKINKSEFKSSTNLEIFQNLPDKSNSIRKEINIDLIKINIEKLPNSQRQIINLFYLEGLTTIEISDFLGVTSRTVENNLYRAKKKLKRILEEQNLDNNSFYDFFNE
jgi:RNA polymerase sigma-19 factor, ECF subfamily